MAIQQLTPVLIVDRIEPSLALWQSLGYEKRAEVPHGDALGFVLLARGSDELMLQSRDSLKADMPAVAARQPEVVLYAHVASLADARQNVSDRPLVLDERVTFYGAREIGVETPSGHVLVLSEKAE
jgi:hypothetical protein